MAHPQAFFVQLVHAAPFAAHVSDEDQIPPTRKVRADNESKEAGSYGPYLLTAKNEVVAKKQKLLIGFLRVASFQTKMDIMGVPSLHKEAYA